MGNIMPFLLNMKQPLSIIWLLSYEQNSYEIFEILMFFKNTQDCFAYIPATKYRSKAVLYSKRTARYPLSPHIKMIAVAYLLAE